MPEARTFLDKVWDNHEVERLDNGQSLLFIDRLLLHELSTPRAFEELRKRDLKVANPDLVIGFSDHIVSTDPGRATGNVPGGPEMLEMFRRNARDFGIRHFDVDDDHQGIVHVVAPELGLILPGMTVVCGDSHTCTMGGVSAMGWGIGTSEIAQVLATQTLAIRKPRTMRVELTGTLPKGVSAKDIVLGLIAEFGVSAGVGHMIEFTGEALAGMTVEARMTLCNMAIEMGARIGMTAPDEATFDYIAKRPLAPSPEVLETLRRACEDVATDTGATWDKTLSFDVSRLRPQITWGTTPGEAMAICGTIPAAADARALDYMQLDAGASLLGTPVNRVFIGSCTNGRLSDLREAAAILQGRKVAANVRALVVPGSMSVKRAAEAEGLDLIFKEAGFEWRDSGCSMCPGLNGDKAGAGERIVSTTNRNFENRQGTGARTHLASPASAAAAAITGVITDPGALAGAGT
jgi:3-isopropylmalate/(R)-2-methylmalate dehydratase large subunit